MMAGPGGRVDAEAAEAYPSGMKRVSKIQEEIRQSKPFHSLSQEAVVALLRTSDVVRSYFERFLEPHGVTLQQYNVMRILRGAGPDGLPTLDVSARMLERTPGVTRLIDRLVRKGFVERKRSVSDRRVVFCMLTPSGLTVLNGLDGIIDHADETALGALDGPDQLELINLLDRIRSAHE
jgi:DNA-binding MarR family transcriptional regulator